MWLIISLIIVLLTLVGFRYKWLYTIAKTYKRDLRGLLLQRTVKRIVNKIQQSDLTVHAMFSDTLKQWPDKVGIYFENETWTYAKLEEFSNKVGHFFIKDGYKKGDIVALLYENRPEYVGLWLGLSKIGVITALINFNQSCDCLLHSLRVSNSKALIFGSSFALNVENVLEGLQDIKLYQIDDTVLADIVVKNSINLSLQLKSIKNVRLNILAELGYRDPLFYIFTSGTSGLPKAAIVPHAKFMVLASTLTFFCSTDDIIYDPLPLYHTVGAMGTGLSLMHGVACVIRKKFSASQYFVDCAKYKCTCSQYVGEMCRYVVNTTPKGTINHNVRTMVGNGLRNDIWIQLKEKFQVKEIYEYYGATEGNLVLVNVDNKVGSIGFIPSYMKKRHNVQIIKYDEQNEQPKRDKNERCIRCDVGETGLLIGKIDTRTIMQNFYGYSDKTQTNTKILYDVFETGDKYFNTGDLVVIDELGYVYFKDRLGDTFRWKSENVSTLEVEEVLNKLLNNSDCVAFGVEVPGTEGKAGMAVIADPHNSVDLKMLSAGVTKYLPVYGIPLFLRTTHSIFVTGTFKLKKTELKLEGFDVHNISDNVYFFDYATKEYVPLTKQLYFNIINQIVRI